MPPGLYPDEAMNGNNALEAVATDNFKLFYPENNGREGLFINIQAFSVAFWGNEPWALRIVSGIFGVLTVLGVFFLARELFRKYKIFPNSATIIALLSAFFLATSFWHTNFSRIGFRAIMLPLLTTFSFYFLFKGFRRGKILDFVWAGIFMGLGFHTYIAFRIVPFVVLAILILKLIELFKVFDEVEPRQIEIGPRKEKIKEFALQIVIFAIFTLLAALPMIYYFYMNPADFIGRAGQVSVFASENPLFELAKSSFLAFAQFNFMGDWNWRHNYAGSPLLFWPVGIFFLIGIYICIKNCLSYFRNLFFRNSDLEIKNSITSPFLMLWFFAMLAPSILSTEGLPHALRSIGAIPPTFIIAGLGAYALYDFAERKWFLYSNKKLFAVFCALIIISIAFAGYYKYFIAYADNPNIKWAFAESDVKIGKFINSLPQNTKKYVIVEGENAVANQTTMFISNSYRKADQLEKNIFYITWDDAEKINFYSEKDYAIIPLNKNYRLFTKLQSYTRGKLIKEEDFEYIIK